MLVTFKTSAYADITMFGRAATTLLKMMGLSGNVPGALMPDDIPEALQSLRAALAAEAQQEPAPPAGQPEGAAAASGTPLSDGNADDEAPVPLASRAGPLLELLEAAHAANTSVLWEE